jgi:hypothetical protein
MSFFSGSVKVGLNFPAPLTLLLSRIDDLALALFGWRAFLIFRPTNAHVPATTRQDTPMPKAA